MVSPRSGLTASASKPYEEEVPVRPMVRPQAWSDHGPGVTRVWTTGQVLPVPMLYRIKPQAKRPAQAQQPNVCLEPKWLIARSLRINIYG